MKKIILLIALFCFSVTSAFAINVGNIRLTRACHAFGGYMDEGYTLPCEADTWTHLTNADNTLWTGSEVDGIDMIADQMVIYETGDYAGSVTITMSALNGKDFHLRVYNTTQTRVEGFSLGISTTGAGNEMSVTVPVYIEATAGDVLQMQVNSTDGTDPILDDGQFYVAYLHD